MHPTHTCTIRGHVEGAHDDAQLLGSCKCHCCTGIGFFELSKDFLLRKFLRLDTLPRRGRPLRIHILQYTLEQDGKLFCNVIIVECQSSHGVWGNLDLLHFFPRFRVWGLGRGGIAIDWVTQRWRFWQMHLRLMYSQATVRSYTKDRAVLRWDHTLKRGRV